MINIRQNLLCTLCFVAAAQLLVACRGEEKIVGSTSTDKVFDYGEVGEIKGFYLLNEGNMGSNKASLDYFDYEDGVYMKNIFAERNPTVSRELGDVGNDLQIYDNKLFAVINCSNLIEIMDANSAKHIAAVSIPNCRFIDFKDDYAYVSSYAGPVVLGTNEQIGYVAKIDLNTYKIVGECYVGRQPDDLQVVGDKLYVANSGGYNALNFDNTLSVIDLNSFEELKKIEIAPNLGRLELDDYGFLWVSSRGDGLDNPSNTFVLDTRTDKIVRAMDLSNGNMWLSGDSLYIYSTQGGYSSGEDTSFVIVDTKTQTIVDDSFIKDGTQDEIVVPYGLAVNEETGELYVSDAGNYVTPGKLRCYSSNGKLRWTVTTGDIPAHIAFTREKLQ